MASTKLAIVTIALMSGETLSCKFLINMTPGDGVRGSFLFSPTFGLRRKRLVLMYVVAGYLQNS